MSSNVTPMPKQRHVTVRWVESTIHRKRTFAIKKMEWWPEPDRLILQTVSGKVEIFPWELVQRVSDESA